MLINFVLCNLCSAWGGMKDGRALQYNNREGIIDFNYIELSIHNVVNVCDAVKTFGNHCGWCDMQFPYNE